MELSNMNCIIDTDIAQLSHAADMLCIGFGKTLHKKDFLGRAYSASEYSLHIQCPWRIIRHNQILLGSADFYEDVNDSSDSGDEYYFFRARLDKITKEILPSKVVNIKVNEFMDIEIVAASDIRINIWNSSSLSKYENWRFINNHTGEHTVVFED